MASAVLVVAAFLSGITSARAYCMYGASCWPDAAAWQRLGQDLGEGRLKKIADENTVFSECREAMTRGGGGLDIGAVTVNQVANGTCSFAGVCVYEDCEQGAPGNLPVYSVEAKTAAHVQAAVTFANKHNIRVSVKSTGAVHAWAWCAWICTALGHGMHL